MPDRVSYARIAAGEVKAGDTGELVEEAAGMTPGRRYVLRALTFGGHAIVDDDAGVERRVPFSWFTVAGNG